jgi:MraZ protein
MQLLGEYSVSLDNKGRMRLPSALLRQLGDKPDGDSGYAFVVNRGFEKCLTLYPRPVWDQLAARINQLNRFNDQNRAFIRTFYLGATPVETDSAERILLHKGLLDYAGITEEAVLVAMNDRVEIWSPQEHQSLLLTPSEQFADLSNRVMADIGGPDILF